MLALLAVFWHGGANAAKPAGNDPVAAAERLFATLQGATPTATYAKAARDLGALIEQARTAQVPVERLQKLRALTDRFRERTRSKLVELEKATQERESELEYLYRSASWDDLSFALAAFPYWRAWINLSLADRVADTSLRPRYVVEAKRGFRAASMQLFQPSLVYGGWFGLGHVAIAEGSEARAIEIFETLERALQPDPDHPLAEVIAIELRLLRAKRGEVVVSSGAGKAIDATEVKLLRAEAFALLERQRTSEWGARPAAERLKRLIDAGRLDTSTLAGILQYRAEIVGQDLGKYTDLVSAEYTFENEHFYDAVRKYQAFFSAPEDSNRVDLDLFRYHYALANLKSDLLTPAVRVVEDLLRRKPSDPEVAASARKLAYIAHAKRYKKHASSVNRKGLAKAARRFLKSAPKDPAADSARLLLAEVTTDSNDALKTLQGVPRSSRLHGQAAQTQFHLFSREFLQQTQQQDPSASAGVAQRGLKVWRQLPPKEQKQHDVAVAALQMRAVSDPNPEKVLREIKVEEERAGITTLEKQALLWARLQIMDRLKNDADMLEYLKTLAQNDLQGWQLEQLYPWVQKKPRPDIRAQSARMLIPGLTNAPSMDRRFQLLLAEALLELDDTEAAYNLAKTFVVSYPKSGDGWQLLARSAQRTDRPFEAERAWRIITDGAPPAADIWWDGMLNRIEIRANSTRPKTACDLLTRLAAREAHIPAGARQRFESLRGTVACNIRAGT